jgi:hypothetical protein
MGCIYILQINSFLKVERLAGHSNLHINISRSVLCNISPAGYFPPSHITKSIKNTQYNLFLYISFVRAVGNSQNVSVGVQTLTAAN